jgi:rhodanese-related sulfurtransferase
VETPVTETGAGQSGRAGPHLWRRVFCQDLAWAGFILVIAALVGLLHHWQLVQLSWRGELRPYLEKRRTQQREVRFQGVKTVSLEQAYALYQEGQGTFIDARPADEYAELHIPGAINLPPDRLKAGGETRLAAVAKDRRIVVYCDQASCDAALKVAEKLQSLGYTQVTVFLGGFRLWDEAGYPADTGK